MAILPITPFNGQIFIDARRVKWKWDSATRVWTSIGTAETLPTADDTITGLLSARDKNLLDSVSESGGGFGLIVAPQGILASANNPEGIIQGDIVLVSESFNIRCIDLQGSDARSGNIADYVSEDGELVTPGLQFSLSDEFLNTLCLEVYGPDGPDGPRGDKGEKGDSGYSDSPRGEKGDVGQTATQGKFSGIILNDLSDIQDTAVVGLELDPLSSKLSYTLAKINVPESDVPADQLITTPIQRSLTFPLLADSQSEFVTLDDWVLSVPAGDPISNEADLLILQIPTGSTNGSEVPLQSVRLTDLISKVVDYYKTKLTAIDSAWLKQLEEFISGKDEQARTILAQMAQRVAECEFQRPIDFCLGITPNECHPIPSESPSPSPSEAPAQVQKLSKAVMIAIYDESLQSYVEQDSVQNAYYPADKSQWSSLIDSIKDDGRMQIRAGIMQPEPRSPDRVNGDLRDLLPSDNSLPGDTERSTITYKFVPFGTPRVTTEDIMSIFNSVRGSQKPTIVVFVLDNSASLLVGTYNSELEDAKIQIRNKYPGVDILEDVRTSEVENWLGAMTRALSSILDTGGL